VTHRDISTISGTKSFNHGFTEYMEFGSIKNQVGPHCVFIRSETDPELIVSVLVALKIEDRIASNKWAMTVPTRYSRVPHTIYCTSPPYSNYRERHLRHLAHTHFQIQDMRNISKMCK
jgi:hypothetical protein